MYPNGVTARNVYFRHLAQTHPKNIWTDKNNGQTTPSWHSANGRLMCHYCGHSEPLPQRCPKCGGPLTFVGSGTQRVQEELQELFPGTKVLRMDADTISAAHTHRQLLQQFDSLYSRTIPEVDLDDIWALDEAVWQDGTLSIPENILTYRISEGSSYGSAAPAASDSVAAVSEVKVGLFHNRQFVAWGTPIEKPANYHGFEGHSFVKFEAVSIPAKEGDTFCYALVVTDEYGRTTVRGGVENALLPVSETAGEEAQLELIEQGYVGY